MEMTTHKTAAPTMTAVRRARAGVGANSRLNHSREPNGNMTGSNTLELAEFI
jgi:hypothetical protein